MSSPDTQSRRGDENNLALIGNCVVAALIDSKGCVVFASFPYLDGDPMLYHLLCSDPVVNDATWGVFDVTLCKLLDKDPISTSPSDSLRLRSELQLQQAEL